jgi:hypothetical protein
MNGEAGPLRVFILGSCVSRDAFEAFSGRFEVVDYIARTSMASVGMPKVEDRHLRSLASGNASGFQRRMMLNDLDKSTLAHVSSTPHDLLLLDFIDERFKLALRGDTFFSCSGELEQSGLEIDDGPVIAPGSHVFDALWFGGLSRLMARVDVGKVVLNRALWAKSFPDGTSVASPDWIDRNNALLTHLYDTMQTFWRVRSIQYPPELVVADPSHRWGTAPYHYLESHYRHAVDELSRIAGSLEPRVTPLPPPAAQVED